MDDTRFPAQWIDVGEAAEITPGQPKLVRSGKHDLAVVRTDDQGLYAVANSCPHEGYPLVQGYVRDCTLTCPWHNFKFDLRDGKCLVGDEDVRSYPVREVDGRVHVDVCDGDPERFVDQRVVKLGEALEKRRLGQVSREVVRLLHAGVPPQRLVAVAATFDAKRAEYGSTHALAVAADVLTYLPRYLGVKAALPIMQAMELAAESGMGRREHEPVPANEPGPDLALARARFEAMVEAEDMAGAEALLRGALEQGAGADEIEPWFAAITSVHFLDFGHALIYRTKVFDLLAAVGWEAAPEVLTGLLRSIVYGTREDTLPRWKWIRESIARHEHRFFEWWAANRRVDVVVDNREPLIVALVDALVSGRREQVEAALVAALAESIGFAAIADAFVAAGSQRLLRFRVARDADVTTQHGWLDVTHCLTVASALRRALERSDDDKVIRLVFFVARFLADSAALDDDAAARSEPVAADRSLSTTDWLAAVRDAIGRRQADRAIELVAAAWSADPSFEAIEALREFAADLAVHDTYTRPIIAAHALKLARVAFEEATALRNTPWAAWPVLAFIRFAASPVRERNLERLVYEAERLVVHGHVPKTVV